eukprot:6173627-Pleurochrysis_carterae.AAC.1
MIYAEPGRNGLERVRCMHCRQSAFELKGSRVVKCMRCAWRVLRLGDARLRCTSFVRNLAKRLWHGMRYLRNSPRRALLSNLLLRCSLRSRHSPTHACAAGEGRCIEMPLMGCRGVRTECPGLLRTKVRGAQHAAHVDEKATGSLCTSAEKRQGADR